MSLGAPWRLILLAVVPALILAYWWMLRRRSERAARLASEGLVPTASARRMRWRRHLPFALFVTAIGLVAFALTRPTMTITLPQRQGTVILAFDVSNSMRAKDLEPTRIEAAKKAAIGFVDRQPRTIKIGVVAFGDSAVTVLRPSSNKEEVTAAIERLSVSGGTSLGQGLYTSLSAIAGKPLTFDQAALNSDAGGDVDIGYFGSSAIVLLSDGENTSDLDPLKLADVASAAGVKVHAIGVGTTQGTVVQIDGFNVATALDTAALKKIADVTDGSYSEAADTAALASVYKSVDLEFKHVKKPREMTAAFAFAGALLLAAGSVLSIVWLGRVI